MWYRSKVSLLGEAMMLFFANLLRKYACFIPVQTQVYCMALNQNLHLPIVGIGCCFDVDDYPDWSSSTFSLPFVLEPTPIAM
jgi:hypothetical protein